MSVSDRNANRPILVEPLGVVTTSSMFWTIHGMLHMTVMVKATFRLDPQSEMKLLPPEPFVEHEEHHEDDPTQSLRRAKERVPFRLRCDACCIGEAYVPTDQPLKSSAARFAVFRDDLALFDKWLLVRGDRKNAGDPPLPFKQMTLVYERAEYDEIENPVGRRVDDECQANFAIAEGYGKVAGFGPISRYWRSRRKAITARERQGLNKPIPRFASSFDWNFFQGAPSDQQLPYLRGDEWIVTEGLSANMPRIQSQLPSVRAEARLWNPLATNVNQFDPIALYADTLTVDTMAQECSVVWRGNLPIAHVETLEGGRLVAGIMVGDEIPDWNEAYRRAPLIDDLSWLANEVSEPEGRQSMRVSTMPDVSETASRLSITMVSTPQVPLSDREQGLEEYQGPDSSMRRTLVDAPSMDDLDKTFIDEPVSGDFDRTDFDWTRAPDSAATEEGMNSTLNRVSIETSSVLTGGAERSFVSGLMDLESTLKGEKASEEKPWAGVAPVAIGDSSDIERVLQGSGIDRDDYESILNSYRTSSV